jgi:MFS transporter, ACS family, allantoate permease
MDTRDAGFDDNHSLEKHSTEKRSLEKQDRDTIAVSTKVVDTAAELVSGEYAELDPAEARRIRSVCHSIICRHLTPQPRRKIDFHIIPLMCSACCVAILRFK